MGLSKNAENIVQRMHNGAELLQTIEWRKLQYFGRIMRGEKYAPQQLILQEEIQGRRRRNRKETWLQSLADGTT